MKVVREKFMNTVGFESRDQLQAFISELYQFLLDQMHIGLNKVRHSAVCTAKYEVWAFL